MIICPRCQTQNPDGIAQCGRCGYPLHNNVPSANPNMPHFQQGGGVPSAKDQNQTPSQTKNRKDPASNTPLKLDAPKIILIMVLVLLLAANIFTLVKYNQVQSEVKSLAESKSDLPLIKRVSVKLDDITTNDKGYLDVSEFIPETPAGYKMLFAAVGYWSSTSPASSFSILSRGSYILSDPNITMKGVTIDYYFILAEGLESVS